MVFDEGSGMVMALACNSSRRGITAVRLRLPAALACAVLLALAAAAPAPAAEPEAAGLGALGRTLIAAIGSAGADEAVHAFGNSLALQRARQRVEAREASAAAGEQREDERLAALQREIAQGEVDPENLPPASAGSNGSYEPRAAARDEALFARSRAAVEDGSTAILLSGIALAPPHAPEAVQGAINNANTIVGRPYIWGGGHQSWYSAGYDCSGAVSFALFGGGLIPRPLVSGDLMRWGAPGPGKWITVYANPGHTFVEIAGLRFDTSGTESGTGPRWHLAARPGDGFVARHPPGL
jgi:cell wall-associated NlpC family hydrolase